jgi:uncharacterized protein YbjT (DUF2867 family)
VQPSLDAGEERKFIVASAPRTVPSAGMKVVLFGSTGMVGQGVLRACLLDPDVSEVLAVVRSPMTKEQREQPKLRELVHKNFEDFSGLEETFAADACFWCLGVTSAGMNEADYTRITHDFTLAAANVLVRPTMTFVFVSGTGADGNAMWARVKRKTEEALLAMPFKDVYVFRPGMIQPLHGIRSRTRLYNILYPLVVPLIAVTKLVKPAIVTDTDRVGRAMLKIAKNGYAKKVLENPDINRASS